jgi:catechol 2,3-dioxygenase-like lactoylglutathione lyase family enzyme
MIAVTDVAAASPWYQQVLGATSGHGRTEYEQLLVDGQLTMQLHHRGTGHHHGTIGDAGQVPGNGVALWFETDDFDLAVRRIRAAGAQIVTDVHFNLNAGHREIWIHDPDGYLVVLAEPYPTAQFTVTDDELELRPIEDPDGLDIRRAAARLEPFVAYEARMRAG